VELFLLPSQVTTWASWRDEHPETLAMINDVASLGQRRQSFSPDFVVGLLLAEESKAYYFQDVAAEEVINDNMGPFPVVVWASENNFHAYLRQVGDRVLTFRAEGETLIDEETQTVWNISRGLAIEGQLKGQALQPVPGSTAFDWAWFDFYPNSALYAP
jgi:hypothetical protein